MTSIHEAMEQQTISIAKAGIQATLNARASILAACNPRNGRYDPTRSLKYNVNMTDPIMSRFDLFFCVLDRSDPDKDEQIARHILCSHSERAEMAQLIAQKMSWLAKVLRFARLIQPVLTLDAMKLLRDN